MDVNNIRLISVDQIDDTVYPTRVVEDDSHMQDLIDSVRAVGIIQPLVVVQAPRDNFALVAGHRRIFAARSAGIPLVPCIVIDADTVDIDRVRLHENLYREDMTAVDEGLLYSRMHDQGGMKIVDIAAVVGKSAPYISQRITILSADEFIIHAVHDRSISFAVARELMGIKDPEKRAYYFRFARDDGASQRTVRRWREQANLDDLSVIQTSSVESLPGGGDNLTFGSGDIPAFSPPPDDGSVNDDGYFRCRCGVVCHVSNAVQTDDGLICNLCSAEMNRSSAGNDGPCRCPACLVNIPAGHGIPVVICPDCKAELDRISEGGES